MTEVVAKLTPSAQPAAPVSLSSGGREILTVAGCGLIAYGLYSILITLLSGGGGPELVVQRISQLVAIFPVLFLGPALLYASHPSARREQALQHVLVRWLVLVTALSYLAFVPLSFFTQYSTDRTNANVIRRLETQMSKRRKEIMTAVAPAVSVDDFRQALSQFPEVTQINISPSDPPAEVRKSIARDIDQGIRNQIQQTRANAASRSQILAAVVRSAALGSLVCGMAMLALALRIIPWLEPLGQATTRSGAALLTGTQRLFKPKPQKTTARKPGLLMQLQKASQNLKRSLNRMKRRWQEKQRSKRLKQRR